MANQGLYSRVYGRRATDDESRIDIGEDFYEATKLYPSTFHRQVRADAVGVSATRDMIHLEQVELPPPQTASVHSTLIREPSTERFAVDGVSLEVIGTLLWVSYGKFSERAGSRVGDERRPVASCGALYPLELYLFAGVEDDAVSIYHYNPRRHCLERLLRTVDAPLLPQLGPPSEALRTAPVIVIIAGLIPRTRFVHGVAGYRVALLEAGAVIQQLQLAAPSLGLGSRPHLLYDQPVEALCGLDGVDEVFIAAVLVGYRGSGSR